MKRFLLHLLVIATAAIIVTACGGPKLATANEQYDRGEYFDAQKTYRKIYNKLTKKEERPLRGEVAFRMGLCYDKLSQSARATAAFQNAMRFGYPDSTALLLLGKNLQAEGKYTQAIKAYEDYLAKVPGNHFAETGVIG